MKMIKKHSFNDISIICENLANLYEDGIQITKAIELLNDFPLKKNYKESLKIIRDEIEYGESLGESFSRFKSLYPIFLIGMISIGEKTGKLTYILKEMSLYYKRKDNMKKEIISASIYPIFLISAMLFITITFFIFIIPSLSDVYSSMGADIPKITKILIKASNYLNENPFIALVYIVLWGILLPIILLKSRMKIITKQILCKFKIINEIKEYEIILLIKVIVSSGTNISLALKYCEEDSNDKVFKELNKEILKGSLLSEVLEEVVSPSKYTIAMIKLGEESGSLDDRLESLTNTLNKRCTEKLKKLVSLIQPSIMIVMSFIVILFISIFVLPIFDGMYGGIK